MRLVLVIVLLLPIGGGVLRAQYCELYFEEFPFGGPGDLDNGTFLAEWCENGATITASNFCLTGESFKLAVADHDPILWVFVDSQSCSAVRLEFDYGQFFDSLTQVRYAVSDDTVLDCGAPILNSAGFLTQTGGICTPTQLTIPLAGDQSVYFQFDHGPTSDALFLDNVSIQLETCDCEGSGSDHGPCETGGPGCDDPVIEACVCAVDPYCCDTAWDEQCVAEVESLLCGDCGGGPVCLFEFAADLGSFFQSGTVCELWPALFENCQGLGPWITSSGDCGGAGDYVMHFGSGFPYSSADTVCLDLSAATEASLWFDFAKDSGTLGPAVEVSVAGGAFSSFWTAPFSVPGGCLTECLDLGPLLGESEVRVRFSSGSSVANGATFDDILLALDSGCPPCTDPVAEAGPDRLLAAGGTAQLAGSAGGGSGGTCPADYSPSWSGPGIIAGGDSFTPTVDQSGVYTLTVSCDSCTETDTVTVYDETVSAALTCHPLSGTLPFETQLSVWLANDYTGQTRTVAGRINVRLDGGQFFTSWRAGYTNIGPAGNFNTSWVQSIPALASMVGMTRFELEAQDVTTAPYNHPPYPPAGSSASDSCTVTGLAP